MPPSSTVTGTNQPATPNDHTHTSPGNPTPHTGTPYCNAPQPFAPTVRLQADSPGQGSAEPSTPNRPPPGPEPSPASRQEGLVEGDWESPKFVQDEVSDLERRKVDTVSNHLTEITKDQREDAAIKLISELSAQFKDDFRKQLASLRIELKADSNENRAALRAEIQKDLKTIIEKNVTETLRSMSVTMTQLNETADVVRKDLQDHKNAVGIVEPVSSGVVEDLTVSVGYAQPRFGRISHVHEDSAELARNALDIISSTAILGPTIDAGVARSGIIPDVPTTPTAAPDTPSDRPSSPTEAQARHFLEALQGLTRLYKSVAFKKRT